MNRKIMSVDVTKVGPGQMESMASITGSPEDISIAMTELIMKINDCVNGSGMFKVQNGFWMLIQDMVNHELAERTTK